MLQKQILMRLILPILLLLALAFFTAKQKYFLEVGFGGAAVVVLNYFQARVIFRKFEAISLEVVQFRNHLARTQALAGMSSFELNLASGKLLVSNTLRKLLPIKDPSASIDLVTALSRVHPDDLQKVNNFIEKISEGESPDLEVRLVFPENIERIVKIKATKTRSDCNAAPLALVIMQDITLYKRTASGLEYAKLEMERANLRLASALQQAREAADTAEKASQAKSEFLSNMSHELRTPLTAVLGMADLLLYTPLAPEQRDYLQTIKKSGQILLNIISDILHLSNIAAGRMNIETVDFDLQSMLEDLNDLLAPKAAEKALDYACLIYPEVPLKLRGDPGRIRQVLVHLAGNAIKFTEQGEVMVSVHLQAAEGDQARLLFEVQDTGIGIAPEQSGRIFEMFVQGDLSSTRKYGGAGIGLSLAKQLVEKMNGTIGVESQPGQGSKFWFALSLVKSAAPKESKVAEAFVGWAPRILIADAHPYHRLWLKFLLPQSGWAIEETDKGEKALDQLIRAAEAGQPFDCLFLDYNLPDLSGEDLLHFIRQDKRLASLPVILTLAGQYRNQIINLCRDFLGGCLTKPIKRSHLQECLAMARRVRFPEEKAPASLPVESVPPASRQPQTRILVVDDENSSRIIFSKILERHGFAVDIAKSGQEAIHLLTKGEYALALLDCYMEDMDGFAVAREIRNPDSTVRQHSLPIVAVTANDSSEDQEACRLAGMDHYLAKPIMPETLLASIHACLEEAAAGRPEIAGAGVIFDRNNLLQRMQGDTRLAKILIEGFLQSMPAHLINLRENLARGNDALVQKYGTAIANAACNIGAMVLEHSALEVQAAAQNADLKKVTDLFPVIREQFEQVQKELLAVGF